MGFASWARRLDDRLVGRWVDQRQQTFDWRFRFGLSGLVIFGGGLALRVLLPNRVATAPLFTAVYVVLTAAFAGLVLFGLRGRALLLTALGLAGAFAFLITYDWTRPCTGGPLKMAFQVISHGGHYTVLCAG